MPLGWTDDQNTDQIIRHTFVRDGRFYFSRRIPADLMDHYKVDRIVRALGTSSASEARKLAAAASAQLDAYWATIRLTRMEAIGHELRVQNTVDGGVFAASAMVNHTPTIAAAITLSEARDLYLNLKGKGRPPTFKAAADREAAYIVEIIR